jgi:hypothetical protein
VYDDFDHILDIDEGEEILGSSLGADSAKERDSPVAAAVSDNAESDQQKLSKHNTDMGNHESEMWEALHASKGSDGRQSACFATRKKKRSSGIRRGYSTI